MNARAQHLRAAGLMLASTMLFGCMALTIRLASHSLHTFEVAFFRNFFGLVATLPLLARHGMMLLRTPPCPSIRATARRRASCRRHG